LRTSIVLVVLIAIIVVAAGRGPLSSPSPTIAAIAAGSSDTCAETVNGALLCWGANQRGELGIGSLVGQLRPTQIVGAASGVSLLALGAHHSCAVINGAADCWGRNDHGQLGNGSYADSSVPQAVSGLPLPVIAIAGGGRDGDSDVGSGHTCALLNDASLWCWGANGNSQLGDGTNISQTLPVEVALGIAAVTTGRRHTCDITTGGAARCWGFNYFGQLGGGGDGTSPVDVTGLGSGVTQIAAGMDHTCALAGGAVICWGYDYYGQLGRGTTQQDTPVPVVVTGLSSGVQALVSGHYHDCALMADTTVRCWGWNSSGQLGDGTFVDRNTPVVVEGLSGVKALAAGMNHTCALLNDGSIKCWGGNEAGQLGDGTTHNHPFPVPVVWNQARLYLPLVALEPTLTPTPTPIPTSTPVPSATPVASPTRAPILQDGYYEADLAQGGLIYMTITGGGTLAIDGAFSVLSYAPGCSWQAYVFTTNATISNGSFEFVGADNRSIEALMDCRAISNTQVSCGALRYGTGNYCPVGGYPYRRN
jgi:alpha-tubulin suppressor-like RCC1 family protein